jgi:hypothetical protein
VLRGLGRCAGIPPPRPPPARPRPRPCGSGFFPVSLSRVWPPRNVSALSLFLPIAPRERERESLSLSIAPAAGRGPRAFRVRARRRPQHKAYMRHGQIGRDTLTTDTPLLTSFPRYCYRDHSGSGEIKPSSAVARARVCESLSILTSGRSRSATAAVCSSARSAAVASFSSSAMPRRRTWHVLGMC